jgi:hypothetical protein
MANLTTSVLIKTTITFNRGETFVFSSWVCTTDDISSFQRHLTMTPNPKAGLVTLPEVIMGTHTGKFSEISFYNQHVDSTSTSHTVSTPEPSCEIVPLHEHFPYGLCNASRAHAEALAARRPGKEIASNYSSDSNPAPSY